MKRIVFVTETDTDPAPPPVQSIKTINVKHVNRPIVQVQLPAGPCPPPHLPNAQLPRALPSGSPLQGGSPEIDLLHIPATLITHSSPHMVKADVWRKSIHQK